MPHYTVDTFRPGLIPIGFATPSGLPGDVPIAFNNLIAEWVREALCREAGAGPTIPAALEDFAGIAWEGPPDVLLGTVVWVRDEDGNIVGTGYYRIHRDDCEWPVLECLIEGDEGYHHRFYREPVGDGYKAMRVEMA